MSHAHALMVLLESDPKLSELTQKDLASALGIDKSNIARLCQRMEDAGHIEQRRSPSDGRARFVKLTKQGADIAREVERSSRARFSSLLESMPRTERSNVLHGLTILTEAVSQSRPRR